MERTAVNDRTHALAGAFSGFAARMITAPFDTMKIRYQVLSRQALASLSFPSFFKQMIKEEGVFALWKGSVPALHLWVSYSAIQFYCYGFLKKDVLYSLSNHHLQTLLSGAAAGTVATLATYPFDLMRTQFVVQHGSHRPHTSMLSFVSHTVKEMGVRGLYTGLLPALLGVGPYMGLNFMFYEALRQRFLFYHHPNPAAHERKEEWTAISLLLSGSAGAIAGGVSKLIVYPMDTVKRRLQLTVVHSTLKDVGAAEMVYSDLSSCVAGICRTEGMAGFYRGLLPTVLKAISSSAVAFLSFEAAVQWIMIPPADSTQ